MCTSWMRGVLRDGGGYDAFAIRCWPETFTEYGGAVCGPAAMMGDARVPCACEADVMGADAASSERHQWVTERLPQPRQKRRTPASWARILASQVRS